MDTIELVCTLSPNTPENLDIITALLSAEGFESFMETPQGINAYTPAGNFEIENIIQLKESLLAFEFTFSLEKIKDQNWNEVWEQNYFKPIVIEDKCLIRSSFHKDFPKTKHEIIIDPKTAFGTGNHATTFLIIKEIFNLEIENKTVLDLGCGTAILAILSRKLNSGKVLAIDNDEKAIINSRENIKINNSNNIDLEVGTAKSVGERKFDTIYENIWKNIVIADMPLIFNALNQGGTVIYSGFYETDIKEVKTEAKKRGFIYKRHAVKDNWAIIVFTKETHNLPK